MWGKIAKKWVKKTCQWVMGGSIVSAVATSEKWKLLVKTKTTANTTTNKRVEGDTEQPHGLL